MKSLEEKNLHDSVVKRTCYWTDGIYLSVHILYLVLFIIANSTFMIVMNIVSILAYVLFYFLIRKGKYYIYALLCGTEIVIFMSISTVLFGFQAGFHLNIIGLCVVSFFTTYFNKGTGSLKKALAWSIMSVLLYLGLHFYCSFNNPIYTIDKWLNVSLYAFHGICAFGFVVSYLLIFLLYAMDLEEKIRNESRTDKLTQISNRYDLYNYLDSIENKTDYALAIFDIDDFKKVNDTYGHVFGDYVLKTIAKIAFDNPNHSFVARYGGEEFVVIIKMYSDEQRTFEMIDEIRKNIEDYQFDFEGIETHVTISCGIARYQDNINIDKWLSLADNKLYECKHSGKNKTLMH